MTASTAGLETKLRALYDREKIGVGGFACKHRSACEKAAGKIGLCRGSEAYVGTQYGSALRIAVIAPDAAGSSVDLAGRKTAAANWKEDGEAPPLLEILQLVRKLIGKDASGRPSHHYFAMIESAKCSSPLEGSPDALHDPCRGYAQAELSVLEPDLVVTLGERAPKVLADFPARDVDVNDLLTQANAVGAAPIFDFLTLEWLTTVSARYLSGMRIGERNTVALHAPHPSDPAWEQFAQLHLPICAWLVRELVSRQAKR